MSDASPAAAALAANQDAEFALALRSAMLEAVHAFAGPQTAMRARMPVQLLADTIYALASLVDGTQSLPKKEEYCFTKKNHQPQANQQANQQTKQKSTFNKTK